MSQKILEQLSAAHAAAGRTELAALLESIAALKSKKLYHQLTEKVLTLVRDPYYKQAGNDELLRLYEGFFKELEPRVKPLSMAQILVEVSTQYDATKGIAFLEGKCREYKGVNEPSALLKTVIAQMHVVASQYDKAKEILSEVQSVLDTAIGIDPSVYSAFYRVLSIYHKNQVRAGDFYKAGLLYLAYTPLEGLSLQVRRDLARDLGIAGLVAEDVYGLGELLSHSLITALEQDAEIKWLIELMHTFNSGKIEQWQQLKTRYAQQISQHHSLAQNMASLLEEKIAILALIELIWSRPSDGRTLPFAAIAAHTRVPLERVELLVMRALSLKLVQGELDQVHALFVVSSVAARILTLDQVASMQARVKAWADHVQTTLGHVEGESASIM